MGGERGKRVTGKIERTDICAKGIGYGFAAAVQPGPFQTYLISQTLKNGWRRTLPAALAPLISDGPILAVVLLVLSQMPGWLTRFLYIVGGCFILYLALGGFRAWRSFSGTSPATVESSQQSVFKAAIMNMLNPNSYIYWGLVTGPILIAGWRQNPVNGIGFLIGFYATTISTCGCTILLFGTARQLGPKINRALLGISAVALTCFGMYQVWRGLQ